jgi:hypothetical protein
VVEFGCGDCPKLNGFSLLWIVWIADCVWVAREGSAYDLRGLFALVCLSLAFLQVLNNVRGCASV